MDSWRQSNPTIDPILQFFEAQKVDFDQAVSQANLRKCSRTLFLPPQICLRS